LLIEDLQRWAFLITLAISVLGFGILYQNFKARIEKDKEERQKALIAEKEANQKILDAKIQELRDHADKKIEDSATNTAKELRELKDSLAIIQTKQTEQNARQAEQYVMVKMFEDYVKTTVADSLKTWKTEPEKDVLLAKFSNDSLTRDEAYLLREYMYAERKAKVSSDRAIFSTYDAMIIMLSLTIERLERKQKANEPCNIS
jgi:hypothetical protein